MERERETMDLRQLQYFITCTQKGSLTRAAEELYTTQPHVSQVIRSLEQELGVRLFRRNGAGVTLTPEGERIRFYAANALKNAALIREVSAAQERGSLRIAANPSSRLALRAEEFFQRFAGEDAAFEYTECGIETMMELLGQRQYDLGFLFLPANRLPAFSHMAERRRLVYQPLKKSDLVVHCGPLGPFYGAERIAPEALDGCRCIQLEDDFFSVEELLYEHSAFRSGRCAIRKQIQTNSDHLMLRMLRETELCNIGSYWQKNGDSATSLTRIDGFEGMVSFGCLRRADAEPGTLAAAFLESLRPDLEA